MYDVGSHLNYQGRLDFDGIISQQSLHQSVLCHSNVLFGTVVNVSCRRRKILKFQFLLINDVFHNMWGMSHSCIEELKTEEDLIIRFGEG